jgi:transposase-like protein
MVKSQAENRSKVLKDITLHNKKKKCQKKCEKCGSKRIKKNDKKRGKQQYKCLDCGK